MLLSAWQMQKMLIIQQGGTSNDCDDDADDDDDGDDAGDDDGDDDDDVPLLQPRFLGFWRRPL